MTPEQLAKSNSEHAPTWNPNADRHVRKRTFRKANGLCRDCGLVPPMPNQPICDSCSQVRLAQGQNRRLKLVGSGICTRCKGATDRKGKHLCSQCSIVQIEEMRQVRKRNKIAVVSHYGGKCVRCFESDPRVMSLHHVNGDGAEHRRADNAKGRIDTPTLYARIYRSIINNKLIEYELELLCFNCHGKEDLSPWWCQ